MSKYYNPRRTRNLYNPRSKKPFNLSRSKIELFAECPRCFYLDRRLGVARPPSYPYTLNSAVDTLLKKEFDLHRAKKTAHPLMKTYKIKAVPFQHEKMDEWRENFKGVQFLHQLTNLNITGAVDDIWQSPISELIVVDYKSTSKDKEVTIDEAWQIAYKRQMEIYQWLLRHNEDLSKYKISNTGYFVYCNGNTDAEAFDGRLEFDVQILPYEGDDSWVEPTIIEAHKCLRKKAIPEASKNCDFCRYREAVNDIEK